MSTQIRASTQINWDADISIGHKLTNVTDPTNPQDVATKAYVDSTGGGTLTPSNFVFNEVPSGTVDGVNVTFTLANTPTVGTVQLYLNGLRQKVTVDYTITTDTITMTTAPLTNDLLITDYMK